MTESEFPSVIAHRARSNAVGLGTRHRIAGLTGRPAFSRARTPKITMTPGPTEVGPTRRDPGNCVTPTGIGHGNGQHLRACDRGAPAGGAASALPGHQPTRPDVVLQRQGRVGGPVVEVILVS